MPYMILNGDAGMNESISGELRSMSYSQSARRLAKGKPNGRDLARAADANDNRKELLTGHYLKRMSKTADSWDDFDDAKKKALTKASYGDRDRLNAAYAKLNRAADSLKDITSYSKGMFDTGGKALIADAKTKIDAEPREKPANGGAPRPAAALTESSYACGYAIIAGNPNAAEGTRRQLKRSQCLAESI